MTVDQQFLTSLSLSPSVKLGGYDEIIFEVAFVSDISSQ